MVYNLTAHVLLVSPPYHGNNNDNNNTAYRGNRRLGEDSFYMGESSWNQPDVNKRTTPRGAHYLWIREK